MYGSMKHILARAIQVFRRLRARITGRTSGDNHATIHFRFRDRTFTLNAGTPALNVIDTIAPDGSYEPWVLKYLEITSDYFGPDKDAVDIGANIGIVSLALAGLQHQGNVVAIEPVSFLFACLQSNLEQNQVPNVTARRAIIDDRDGMVREIQVPAGAPGGATVAGSPDRTRIIAHSETVPTAKLDTYLREQHPGLHVKILKIDVENWELPVLNGAAETIRSDDPVTLIEFNVQHRSLEVERGGFDLYQRLSSLFKHLFLIDRLHHDLIPIRSYAELRGAMLTGHFVEDLLCFNDANFLEHLRPHVSAPRFPTYFAGKLTLSRSGRESIVSLSHYPDNWCHGHDFFLHARVPVHITLTNAGPHEKVRLRIADGNAVSEFTLARQPVERVYGVNDDGTFIHVFVEQIFSAAGYFQNEDPREPGIQISVREGSSE